MIGNTVMITNLKKKLEISGIAASNTEGNCSMSTIWRYNEGGKVSCMFDVSEEYGSPTVIFAHRPDWVRLPPDLGEGQLRVLDMYRETVACWACEQEGEKQILTLEQDYIVMACPLCGQYCWGQL